jgi:hypothetical protein
MANPKGKVAPVPGETKILIKGPGQKANFWKPQTVGETKVGKLTAIVHGKFGASLKIAEASGTVTIPVNVFLEDIDWTMFKGKILSFEFNGVYGRGCRLYTVHEVQEPVPF